MANTTDHLAGSPFAGDLLDAIMQYSMLKHPFYVAWSEGKLSKPVLAEYAKQYYAHVRAFPTYVSAVHSHCDDLQVRKMLLENLIEEERGENNHPELWLRFAEGLGVARDEVSSAPLLASTMSSVNTFKSLTGRLDYREGLAALYAYESQIPEVAHTKRAGLRDFYGISDAAAVSFFTVHESADQVHRQVEARALERQCETDDVRDCVVAAGVEGAKALWNFLDGIQAAYLN
jgi:pyrroloquinoline-quinone synthase